MKRRFGMWIGILCILVIGISITKITTNFVLSNGVEASSILSMAKPAAAADAEMPAEEMTPELASETFEVSKMMKAESAMVFEQEPEAEPAALMEETMVEAAMVDETVAANAAPVAGQTSGPGMAFSAAPASTATIADGQGARDPGEREPEDTEEILERMIAVQENGMKDQTAVKSPLDPVVATNPVVVEIEEPEMELTVADFFQRFEMTESSSLILWDNVSTDNAVAYRAAAEQERVLWEYELNLINQEIRSRMPADAADELKRMEIEWYKTRDQYAERTAAKSTMMNSQNQNPAYIRAQAEKTKERCYWLVSEYEDILNQADQEASDEKEMINRP